jgi:hypothetical protein
MTSAFENLLSFASQNMYSAALFWPDYQDLVGSSPLSFMLFPAIYSSQLVFGMLSAVSLPDLISVKRLHECCVQLFALAPRDE